MMKRLALLLVVVLAFASCAALEQDVARSRVSAMMKGWQDGGTSSDGHIQTAVSVWYEGNVFIPNQDVLGDASVAFDVWRRQKGLYRAIESWEITSVESLPESVPPVWFVGIDIDGRSYRMRVEENEPIEWAD